MNISSKQSKEKILLILEGEVTIREASKLKETLLKHLAKKKNIEMNLERVSKIDTAGLQLLYSTYKTAVQTGKTFSLKKCSAVLKETANLAGISMLIKNN